ncbi:MAG: restriction endonuclease, SacI family [Aeromicrobium sp.]|uniref:restriction endonuclease, SacI family n=1 Tax=Aeromicrobium sp. TaxID=1871063 RepID=UPI0039E33BBE
MPVKIDYVVAEQVLLEALAVAQAGFPLPVEWVSHARTVFALEHKTWTPAFATLLLAKATDERVDALSIKAEVGNPNAYSLRGLGHKVVVPAALEHDFSIRNTGREPLNNQPFFRYDRIDKIDRVRHADDFNHFLDIAKRADKLSSDEAKLALASFLKVALEVNAKAQKIKVEAGGLTSVGARVAVADFLRYDADDRPQRLQAFAAACLDLLFDEVKTRRINDPSRDVPGDVHAFNDSKVVLAVEVRGKAVSRIDLSSFARSCAEAGLQRAVMFVDAPQQPALDMRSIAREAGLEDIQVETFESASDLLFSTSLWSRLPLNKAIQMFSQGLLARLREIEVAVPTLEEWARAIAVAGAR